MTTQLVQRVLPGFEHLVPLEHVHLSLWGDPTVNFYEDALGWHIGTGGWSFIVGSLDYCVKTLEKMEQATRRYLGRGER